MLAANYAALAVLPLLAGLLYAWLRQWRYKKYNNIPVHLPQSLLLGHLGVIAEGFKRIGDSRRHFDYVLEGLMNDVGRPQVLLLDLRPVSFPMLCISSHEVAEQLSKVTKLHPWSVNKSPTLATAYRALIGHKSLLTQEGDTWKNIRKRFNIGFAPQHLITLLPQIIDKTSTFMSKLDKLAKSGEEFELDPLCTNLTFDIIGEVVMNRDFKAQSESGGSDIVRHFHSLISTYTDTGRIWLWLNVPVRIRRYICSRRADAAIKEVLKAQFEESKVADASDQKQRQDRSVVALAFKDTSTLTSEILQSTADQVKTFLFAGHDTTSILLQRLFYALSIHPKSLATIRAEHDAIFGSADPREVFLEKPDTTLQALTYTSACIKEALRLWPPAGSARRSLPGKGLRLRLEDGEELSADGIVIYLCHRLIQRDPKVYGDTANDFVPERWLGDTDTSAADIESTDRKIPASAWRPFERGPRNCIGQELANLEARVIVACVMRRYDFTKVGAGAVELDEKGRPIVDESGAYRTTSELFNSQVVTSKPFDKCRMTIKMH